MAETSTKSPGTDRKAFQRLLLLFLLIFPSLIYLFFSTGKTQFFSLPFYGPREPHTHTVEGETVTDTIYHTVPSFSFINQDGKTITEKDVEGKVYVSDFFFASCEGICPKMTSNLLRVQEKFKDHKFLIILSHTVDPERDSAEALLAYAEKVHAKTKNWHFLTGDKKALYDIARNGYFVTAMKGDGGPEDFIHSEKLVLIDKEKHIRGFYDGTTVSSVDSLIDDIKILQADYARKDLKKNKIKQGKN